MITLFKLFPGFAQGGLLFRKSCALYLGLNKILFNLPLKENLHLCYIFYIMFNIFNFVSIQSECARVIDHCDTMIQ